MSGHSKWSQIKRKKGINDQKRGAVFSKLSKIITLAVKEGGRLTDPEKNIRLRLAVERARADNMPKVNIERAIKHAQGPESNNLVEVVYDAFGSNGVVFLIVAHTDNNNRTHIEVKNILEKNGGKMGVTGSVSYLFDKCGLVVFDKSFVSEEVIMRFAERIGAIDIEEDAVQYAVFVPFDKIGHVNENLNGLDAKSIEIYYRPKDSIVVDESVLATTESLIEKLEEQDDVDRVYTNLK